MRAVYSIVLAGLLGAAVASTRGQTATAPRAQETLPGSRTLKTFDFEETALGNLEPTPMYWSKVVGKGFPQYSAGAFDHSQFRSAKTSFMLKTDGGSVAYRFTPPAEKCIRVNANADYYVIAFVRTSQLKHARADVTAWYADANGNLILNSETHSQVYSGSTEANAWQVLYVHLPGPAAEADGTVKAKSLVLQLGLMQPQQLGADAGLGKFALYQQDVQGAVWFDDVTVFQLPRVSISPRHEEKSPAPPRMFASGEPVVLDVELADLTQPETEGGAGAGAAQKSVKARVRVTNPEGLLFAEESWTAAASPTQGGGGSRKFTHASLPPGMYTATLEVLDEGGGKNAGLLARRQTQFLCLSDGAPPGFAAAEFGLGAVSYDDVASWKQLPQLLRQTGAGTLQIPAWRREMSEEALTRRDVALEEMLAALQRQKVRVVGTFSQLPRAVSSQIGLGGGGGDERTSIQALLNAATAVWRPPMSFLLTRYANRFDWWELGSPAEPFSGTPGMNTSPQEAAERSTALYKKTYGEIGSLLTRPELVIPWNALFDFDAQRYPHAVLDLWLPAVIKPSQIPAYVENFRQAGSGPGNAAATRPSDARHTPIFAHLEGLDAREVSREDRLADFAQRVVFSRIASPESMLLDVDENKPDELLLVYATMIRALGGSTFEGELPLAADGGRGVRAFLFRRATDGGDGDGGATLVLWTDVAGREASLDLPLGKGPRTRELLGNARALKTDAATRLTHLTVGTTPLVVENVEPQVLMLTSSFALSTPFLPAGAGSVRTEVLLKNPFDTPLTGALRIVPPKGWTMDPPSLPVTLAAGASLRQEVTLRFPFTENAGVKKLDGLLTLEAGNPAGTPQVRMMFPVTVNSDAVDMEAFTQVDANGDILLQQVITNYSGEALDAQAYALVPGFPQQHRYVVALPPNQSTIKRYTFSRKDYAGEKPGDAAKALLGAAATLGVKQNDGRTLLTKSVPIE